MRSLVIFVAVVAFVCGDEYHRTNAFKLSNTRIFEGQYNRTSECLKDKLNKGNPSIGLPSFNPLFLRDLTLDLNTWGIIGLGGKIDLHDFVIRDLANWVVPRVQITVDPPGFETDTATEWPSVELEGQYNLEMELLGQQVRGSGKLIADMKDNSIAVKQHVMIPLQIKSMETHLEIGVFKFHIDEVTVDGLDITDRVNERAEHVVAWLDEHAETIGAVISQFVMAFVNNIDLPTTYGLGEIVQDFLTCLD